MEDGLIGKRFKSNNYGDFEVLSYIGKGYYKIKFIDTGCEKEYKCCYIKKGAVMDSSLPRIAVPERNKLTGKIFNIPHKGDILVLNRVDSSSNIIKYKVRFLKTGEEGVYRKQKILLGQIGKKVNRVGTIYYNRYKLIKYDYVKDTEMFLDLKYNVTFSMCSQTRKSKLNELKWIKSTNIETGNISYFYNYSEFAEDNNLQRQGIQQVLSGRIKKHKGYKFEYVD